MRAEARGSGELCPVPSHTGRRARAHPQGCRARCNVAPPRFGFSAPYPVPPSGRSVSVQMSAQTPRWRPLSALREPWSVPLSECAPATPAKVRIVAESRRPLPTHRRRGAERAVTGSRPNVGYHHEVSLLAPFLLAAIIGSGPPPPSTDAVAKASAPAEAVTEAYAKIDANQAKLPAPDSDREKLLRLQARDQAPEELSGFIEGE